MRNFTFECATKIVFGKGTQTQAGPLSAAYGKRALLCYGGGSIKKSGLYDEVVRSLHDAGVAVTELPGVQANPRVSLVREGIAASRRDGVDFILAVGGGSVIDTAKAVAEGVPYDGDVWDFFCGKAKIEKMLPVGTVLTIPAAGSESSDSNVITNEETHEKNGSASPMMRPVFSILNPELTYTLPPYQTACGCMDIMAHVMERYFTNEPHVELTDRLCTAILRTVLNNLPVVLRNPKDYDARAQIMWAGTIGQNGLVGTGREEDWANHVMEHQLSGFYDIAHGAGLSITFPAWMRYVAQSNPGKLFQFSTEVLGVEGDHYNPERTVQEGIDRFERILRDSGLPTHLSEAGIGDERLEEMALRCTGGGVRTIGAYVPLGKSDIVNILRLAL